jgi:hypothetical protein
MTPVRYLVISKRDPTRCMRLRLGIPALSHVDRKLKRVVLLRGRTAV